MKTLQNKVLEDIKDGAGKPQTYAVLAKACLQEPPKNNSGQSIGFSPDEMRSRNRIQDVLDISKDKIELEDADAAKLKQCVEKMSWAKMDKCLVTFTDDVIESFK